MSLAIILTSTPLVVAVLVVAAVPVAVEDAAEFEAIVPGVAIVDPVVVVAEVAAPDETVAVTVSVESVSPPFPPFVLVLVTTIVLPCSVSVSTTVVVAAGTAAGPAYFVQNPNAWLLCAVRIE